MKPHNIRRRNLRAIIERQFDGKAGRLADAIGKKRPQIYRLFSDAENSRDIGEELARDIENRLGLPYGSLDKEEMANDEANQIAQKYEKSSEEKRTAMKSLADLPDDASADLQPILDAFKAKYGIK